MKALKIFLKISGYLRQIKNGHVLIWICDRLCFVDAQKAFVYNRAKLKGIKFESSAHFEEWYLKVKEEDFPTGQPTKSVRYWDGEVPKTLFWT